MRDGRRQPGGRIAYTPELAAMLVHLNRTGFKGLFRLNARSGFDVPAGRYRTRTSSISRSSLVWPRQRRLPVCGWCSGRSNWRATSEPRDFLYVDPPYAPLSRTSNFTSYTASRFGGDDQARLQQLAIEAARRGCYVLISNSTASEIAALYEHSRDARAAGLRTIRVPARRAINSNASRRVPSTST